MEASVDRPPIDHASYGIAEDEPVWIREVLSPREVLERLGSLRNERNGSSPARLGSSVAALVRIAAADEDRRLDEVDIAPAQRTDLREPKTGQSSHEIDRGVLLIGSSARKSQDFSRRIDVDV